MPSIPETKVAEFIGRFNELAKACLRAKNGVSGQEAVDQWWQTRDLARDMLVAMGCEVVEAK